MSSLHQTYSLGRERTVILWRRILASNPLTTSRNGTHAPSFCGIPAKRSAPASRGASHSCDHSPHIAVVFGGACGHILPRKESKETWYLRAKPEYDLTIWWVISEFISNLSWKGVVLLRRKTNSCLQT